MANWEFENDSTTNYLRAQDKVAQNPIDFHENGTVESSAVSTKKVNNTKTVTDVANLQTALDNYDNVYIDSPLTPSSTITVPPETTLFGYGRYDKSADTVSGGCLRASLSAPVLKVDNNARLKGIAVANDGTGAAVRCIDGLVRIESCDLVSRNSGNVVNMDTTTSASDTVENVIHGSRITGPDAASGSVGVDIVDIGDCEIRNSIVRYCDIGTRATVTDTRISGCHYYQGGGGNTATYNIDISADLVHINDCYLEGVIGSSHIHCTSNLRQFYHDNEIRLNTDNTHGVHFDFSSSQDLVSSEVVGNVFFKNTNTPGTNIQTTNVSGVFEVLVDNVNASPNVGLRVDVVDEYPNTGDGTTKTWTIPHSLIEKPQKALVTVSERTSAGEKIVSVSRNSSDITVTTDVAPANSESFRFDYKLATGRDR